MPAETTNRVTVILPARRHRELKARLAADGVSISTWMRIRIEEFLQEPQQQRGARGA